MVSSKLKGGNGGATVFETTSRVSMATKGHKIYTGSEVDTSLGNAREPPGCAARKSLGRPPVAGRKSTPVFAFAKGPSVLSALKHTEEKAKEAGNDISKSKIAGKLKTGRTALADISNVKAGRGYQLRSRQNCTTTVKKDKAEKNSILHRNAMKGFNIYMGGKVDKGVGNPCKPPGGATRKSLGKPPVAERKSMPVFALAKGSSAFSALKDTKAKKAGNDVSKHNTADNLKTRRKTLADVTKVNAVRNYQVGSRQKCKTSIKKGKTDKNSMLPGNARIPCKQSYRESLTKTSIVANSSSKNISELEKLNEQVRAKLASMGSRISGRKTKLKGSSEISKKNLTSEISRAKNLSNRLSGGTKLIRRQDRKGSSLSGQWCTGKLHWPRPSLSSNKLPGHTILPGKPGRASGFKMHLNSKVKLVSMSRSTSSKKKPGALCSFIGKKVEASTSLDCKDTAAVNTQDCSLNKNEGVVSCSSDENMTLIISKPKCNRRRSYTSSLVERYEVAEDFIGSTKTATSLPCIDDSGNPLEAVEYIDDIYQYYWSTEMQNPLFAEYMAQQDEISPRTRGVLINWLIEVHLKFDLIQETLFLMVELLDRTLSLMPVKKSELQLVGLTVLLLASKYEDCWHPKVKDLVSISANVYTRDQMLAMEKLVLIKLRFRLNLPTPYVFILRFLKAARSESKLEHLAFYLIELCLVEYDALRYKPSLLSASAVYLARCTLHVCPPWGELLKKHARYEEEDLRACASMILDFQRAAYLKPLKTTYEKFTKPDRSCVALLKPINRLP